MGFELTPSFVPQYQGSLVFWTAQKHELGAGVSIVFPNRTFFNPGGVGPFSRIGIMIEASADPTSSTFDLTWKGGAEFGEDMSVNNYFWTAIPITSTEKTFFYYTNTIGDFYANAGTATYAPYMFDLPYYGFTGKNTGAETIEVEIVAFGSLT